MKNINLKSVRNPIRNFIWGSSWNLVCELSYNEIRDLISGQIYSLVSNSYGEIWNSIWDSVSFIPEEEI